MACFELQIEIFSILYTVSRLKHPGTSRGGGMASNFRISIDRSGENIQIKLTGDFDGSSALHLLYLMHDCLKDSKKIFINTDFLGNIEPFGINVFRYNLDLIAKYSNRFVFSGEKAWSLIKSWPDNIRPECKIKKESVIFHTNVHSNSLNHAF
jgi:hypothetical protein